MECDGHVECDGVWKTLLFVLPCRKTINPVCRQSETGFSCSSKVWVSNGGDTVKSVQSSGCWINLITWEHSVAGSKLWFHKGEVSAATEGLRTHLPLKMSLLEWLPVGLHPKAFLEPGCHANTAALPGGDGRARLSDGSVMVWNSSNCWGPHRTGCSTWDLEDPSQCQWTVWVSLGIPVKLG